MKRRYEFLVSFAVIAAVALLGVVGGGAARAQIDDHLECYQMHDTQKTEGIVDLLSKQFGLEAGCKLGKARLFCVPTTKRVVELGVDGQDAKPLDVPGRPAPGDRICYSLQCPKPYPDDQDVTDQFGNRRIQKLRPAMLCTPAVKGGPPECGDGTVDPGEECDPPGTFCDAVGHICDADCQCPDPYCGDGILDAGEDCDPPGSLCPDGNVCSPDCRCPSDVPTCLPGISPYPECNGTCPPGLVCEGVPGAAICDCLQDPTPCEDPNNPFPAPACWGACPDPTQVCGIDPTGLCRCLP